MKFNQIKDKITKAIPWILGISAICGVTIGIFYDLNITVRDYLDEHFYLFFIPLIPIFLGGILLVLNFARMGLQAVFEEYHKQRNRGVPPERALFIIVMIILLITGFFYLGSLSGSGGNSYPN